MVDSKENCKFGLGVKGLMFDSRVMMFTEIRCLSLFGDKELKQIFICSMAHGQDEWDFETVGVKWWQIESSFASQAIEALMTWGY